MFVVVVGFFLRRISCYNVLNIPKQNSIVVFVFFYQQSKLAISWSGVMAPLQCLRPLRKSNQLRVPFKDIFR